MFDDEDDDRYDDEEFQLTPIEQAIRTERAMMRTIRAQEKEIERLQAELSKRTTELLSASEERSALVLAVAMAGGFTKESVEKLDGKPFTVARVLAADAAKREASGT